MGWRRKPPGSDVRRVCAIGNNIRGVVTNKVGRIVQYESFAERSLLLRLERNPLVCDYASQPETLSYITPDGKSHRYTPDFMVWYRNGRIELHEVTLSSRTERIQQQARMTAAREICQERGWYYIVHTEQTLPQGAELSNLLVLIAYRPVGYANAAVQTWLRSQHQQAQTFGKLAIDVGTALQQPYQSLFAALYHEIWHGQIEIDWHRMLLHDGQPIVSMPIIYGAKHESTGNPTKDGMALLVDG
jgi:hypothetical protein